MTEDKSGQQMGEATKARREAEAQRLAQALRDNLAKRKAQGRARQDTGMGETESSEQE